MPKTKNVKYVRKRPTCAVSNNRQPTFSRQKQNVKAKPKIIKVKHRKSSTTTDSETSPFKGFNNIPPTNMNVERFYDSFGDEEYNLHGKKENLFEKLLDESYKSKFNQNMKTYANKKKHILRENDNVLEFHECKNRNDILRWLNDNQNVFEQLTQTTQSEIRKSLDTQFTFDMPSVSQRNTPRTNNRLNQETKNNRQGRYRLRARSLNIEIQKNEQESRNKKLSLVGNTLGLEDYQIEDVITKVEAPLPPEQNAKIIVDLMEDEYLNKLEKEILQCESKKNQNGWDRIRNLNNTLNTKKRPRQLKILVHETQNNSNGELYSGNPAYDYNTFETYFKETSERLFHADVKITALDENECTDNGIFQVGKKFFMLLQKFLAKNGHEKLTKFTPLVADIKQLFNINSQTIATQTIIPNGIKHTQTYQDVRHIGVQTDQMVTRIIQVIPTENHLENVEVQTEDLDSQHKNLNQQVSSVSSATTSEIYMLNSPEKLRTIGNKTVRENEDKTGEFVNIRTKRFLPESPEMKSSKRPCSKFIDENLSVGFSSCNGKSEDIESKAHSVQWSEDSDFDEFVANILTKYENDTDANSKLKIPRKTKTQEQIEQLEEVIVNATKFSHGVDLNKKEIKFRCHSVTNRNSKISKDKTQEQIEELEELENMIHNAINSKGSVERAKHREVTLTKEDSLSLEADMDYFKTSFQICDDVKSPKNIGRESMLENEKHGTADYSLTENKADVIIKGFDKGGEQDLKGNLKINILEDIVFKQDNYRSAIGQDWAETFLSDDDLVECTPNTNFPNFNNQRKESALDVTLPPPFEFQDTENQKLTNNHLKSKEQNDQMSPPRRPLAVINKITSTPISQKSISENFLSLSPISYHGDNQKATTNSEFICFQEKQKSVKISPLNQEHRLGGTTYSIYDKNKSNRQNKRVSGPYELTQHQVDKYCPLTITKTLVSQDNYSLSGTPKQKSILTYIRPAQVSQRPTKSLSFESAQKRKPCIACSRMTRDQMLAISSMVNKRLATYSDSFSSKVTHMIVSTNEKKCLKDHTIKYVSAVAAGVWVLNFNWVRECLLKNCLVPEEPYEALDVSGQPGPQNSRLLRTKKPLLKGYKIYAANPFSSIAKEEVEKVIIMLGGKVVRTPEQLLDKNGYICVIITEARASQNFELHETWLEALRVVTVDLEWLSRSVGQYHLLSLRPFSLCSEDTMDTLGYPPELTANMTYSLSQQTFSTVPSLQ